MGHNTYILYKEFNFWLIFYSAILAYEFRLSSMFDIGGI